MLKTIKVKPEVYADLERIQDKRESFSETIARLIQAYDQVQAIRGGKP